MKYLFILNDPPYGTERDYNGLRLATKVLELDREAEVTVFLLGDSVTCAKAGQQTPDGYYNLGRMLKPIVRRGELLLCGSCMEARGMKDAEVTEGAQRSNLARLAEKTIEADKVLVF